jgi:ankyrin repeat protein
LQHGVSIDTRNNRGNTALHEAVAGKHVFVVELLLLHGASVHILNERQRTALDCAERVSGASEEPGRPLLCGLHEASFVPAGSEMAMARSPVLC